MKQRPLQWVELSRAAFLHNLQQFRRLLGDRQRLLAMVKANAYGHGMARIAVLAEEGGADWLGVHTLAEGITLQDLGIKLPILICGYVPLADLEETAVRGLSCTVYNPETIEELGPICRRREISARIHIKLETGTHRQGVAQQDLPKLLDTLQDFPEVKVEGVSSHFADIEDTTDHTYARQQLEDFQEMVAGIKARGLDIPIRHMSCTAAGMLFPETHFDMLRVGIGLYGLWPSRETYVSCLQRKRALVRLQPVLTWQARVAQVKRVPKGAYIGYGRSYRTTRETRLAVLPVGYSDGYPRRLSNVAHTLIRGQRSPVRGRIAMNFLTTDVSDIPEVQMEEAAVLLGVSDGDAVTAEMLAAWAGTINYEIVARLNPQIPRIWAA